MLKWAEWKEVLILFLKRIELFSKDYTFCLLNTLFQKSYSKRSQRKKGLMLSKNYLGLNMSGRLQISWKSLFLLFLWLKLSNSTSILWKFQTRSNCVRFLYTYHISRILELSQTIIWQMRLILITGPYYRSHETLRTFSLKFLLNKLRILYDKDSSNCQVWPF